MTIHIQTDKLEIKFTMREEFKCMPSLLTPELLKELDDYPPHHVEAIFENDPTVERVSVDWYLPWNQQKQKK